MSSEAPYKPRDRKDTLSFMAALSVRANQIRAAEGYLLELLAYTAFGREEDEEGALLLKEGDIH